jgi:(1->4)-alpha-D-glucan 1-alpha-D-glucosylmutase
MPSRNDEYMVYQTLVGAWPIEQERVLAYMEKACREALRHTSWTDPNKAYEDATASFVNALYADQAFIDELDAFVAEVVEPGRVNALAQTLIKLTAPGVADLYQGTELWRHNLADPDNRRAVDFERCRALLSELKDLDVDDVMARSDEGLPKLWLVRRTLRTRQDHPEAFGPGSSYRALQVSEDRGIAFLRGERLATIVPRLVAREEQAWKDAIVALPAGRWHNALTGEAVEGGEASLGTLLARFPVALLVKADQDEEET